MKNLQIIYESAFARMRGERSGLWRQVLVSGLRLALIYFLVFGCFELLVLFGREPRISLARAAIGVAGISLFGMVLGAFIEWSGREIYLYEGGLVIRQTGLRRLRTYAREGLVVRRTRLDDTFDSVEIRAGAPQNRSAVLWIKHVDADKLEAWVHPNCAT